MPLPLQPKTRGTERGRKGKEGISKKKEKSTPVRRDYRAVCLSWSKGREGGREKEGKAPKILARLIGRTEGRGPRQSAYFCARKEEKKGQKKEKGREMEKWSRIFPATFITPFVSPEGPEGKKEKKKKK